MTIIGPLYGEHFGTDSLSSMNKVSVGFLLYSMPISDDHYWTSNENSLELINYLVCISLV